MQPVYPHVKIVYIKQVKMHDQDSHVALMLSFYQDPTNYTVPILVIFADTSYGYAILATGGQAAVLCD